MTVQILPAPLERTLREPTGAPAQSRRQLCSAEAQPAAVDVAVRGNRDALAHVAADDVTAFVDLAGLGAGRVYADRACGRVA